MSALQAQRWPAPAKLNLMLRVIGRRDDGYHLLQTVFQFLELGDWLRLRARDDGRILRLRPLPGVESKDDLALRAAHLLQQAAGCSLGVEIELDKRLPMGGGLGGGSSDAASVLLVLNQLWGLRLGLDDLATLGLQLGADVPVFVRGEAAWGEGVGERLTPVQLPEPWYLVVMPACQVATGAVFSAPELTRNSTPITIRAFLQGSQANDCLPVVRRNYPEVAAALDWLDRFAPARLTGTGACVFAAFATEDEARAPLALLPAPWRGWVARGRNVSPLHTALGSAAV